MQVPYEATKDVTSKKKGLIIMFAILIAIFAVLDIVCIYMNCKKDKESYPEFDEEDESTPTKGGDREGLI